MCNSQAAGMKVLFLGTGEAFDPHLPNNSAVVIAPQVNILVDCGFNIPQQFFNLVPDPDFVDAVYLTHMHADHCFGLPAIMVWMMEQGRTKPFHLLGPAPRLQQIVDFADLGYPGITPRLGYELRPVELSESSPTLFAGLELRLAKTVHGAVNHAIRLDAPCGASVMLSGDGEVTRESAALFADCGLVIHEAYRITEHTPGHSSVREVLETASAQRPQQVALVHTSRAERHLLRTTDGPFVVPAPGALLTAGSSHDSCSQVEPQEL